MAYEFLERPETREQLKPPLVKIQKGILYFNCAARRLFGTQSFPVLLGYDAEKKSIAIKILTKHQTGSRTLTLGKAGRGTCQICATFFVEYFKVPQDSHVRYPVCKEESMYTIDLNNGKQDTDKS